MSGNYISDRLPLQEHSINGGKITDTPVSASLRYKSKMTTPPESIFGLRKKSISFETPKPVKGEGIVISSSLLSPAFSSPQRRGNIHGITHQGDLDRVSESDIENMSGTSRKVHAPSSPPCINLSTSSLSFSSDDTYEKPKKKAKKSKKEAKDTAFDLDSEDKPPYSYATLIGISILSHKDKRLPLSQIYQWISDTFKYYKREDVGWQNSIRHNLSLNKAFVKGEKSKDGKGHFWCIKPGHEEQFLKSRSVKKSSYHEVMDQINNANSNRAKNAAKEEIKRSMNTIPSSPNQPHNTRPKNSRKRSAVDNDDDDDDEFRYTYNDTNEDDDNDEDDGDVTHILDPPQKKQKNNNMLGEPFSHWDTTSALTKTPVSNTHPPQFVISESPNKPLLAAKNLTYTSSFSCNSNLELSPMRLSETGPLLEPLTPANNIYQTHHQLHPTSAMSHLAGSTSSLHTSTIPFSNMLQKSTSSNPYNHNSGNFLQRTPKSNILRTPMRNLRTPQTNSIMKKLWNSPSYLEDFYYSPLVNSHSLLHNQFPSGVSHSILDSYDDDDMVMRNFEAHHGGLQHSHHQSPSLERKLVSMASITSSLNSGRNLFDEFKVADATSSVSSVKSVNDDSKETNVSNHLRSVSSTSTEADSH
jgi:forkhead transcription factor HCM1